MNSIGLVGGGQMGEALIRGIIGSGLLQADRIMVAEPAAERLRYLEKTYGIRGAGNENELAAGCDIVILAVKPQIMDRVLAGYREHIGDSHLVISIAAGITIAHLEEGLGKSLRIVRAMPNTPALVLAGATAFSSNSLVSADDRALASRIFNAVGTCVEVGEPLLDAVTGLSGSGPGYVFAFIEALIDGGVLAGLPREIAEKLVLQTVFGSAKLALETGEPASVLRGRVTSPGGTTIAGLQVLEEAGLRGAVMSAVEAATERSQELGQ